MKALFSQINLIWLAISFFTRLPVPNKIHFSQGNLNHASRYFTLVGWIVGALCTLAFIASSLIFDPSIAIVISMGFGFLLTGGFHEDGLADTADGFGGGWTQQQKLNIMKDSRLGSYGALAIWFFLTLKYLSLSHFASTASIAISILIAHPLSRLASTLVIQFLPYVSDTEHSKSKPIAHQPSKLDAMIAMVITIPVFIFPFEHALWLILTISLTTFIFCAFMKQQIMGFTGDTLGATQQVNELAIYLTLLAKGFNL